VVALAFERPYRGIRGPLLKIHNAANVNKLPVEEFADQSLVYSTVTKR
jgi:hypothetical protein